MIFLNSLNFFIFGSFSGQSESSPEVSNFFFHLSPRLLKTVETSTHTSLAMMSCRWCVNVGFSPSSLTDNCTDGFSPSSLTDNCTEHSHIEEGVVRVHVYVPLCDTWKKWEENTFYLSHPEDQHCFSGLMKSCSGSRVGASRSFLDINS